MTQGRPFNPRSNPAPPALKAQLQMQLQKLGVSPLGAEQLLSASPLVSADDRAKIARLLAHLLTAQPRAATMEIYDWPGDYAQRFDGIDKGGDR
jgi:hypothetical protein